MQLLLVDSYQVQIQGVSGGLEAQEEDYISGSLPGTRYLVVYSKVQHGTPRLILLIQVPGISLLVVLSKYARTGRCT